MGEVIAIVVFMFAAWIIGAVILFGLNVYLRLDGRPKRGSSMAAAVFGLGSIVMMIVDGSDIFLLPLVGGIALFALGVSNFVVASRLAESKWPAADAGSTPAAPTPPPPRTVAPPWP